MKWRNLPKIKDIFQAILGEFNYYIIALENVKMEIILTYGIHTDYSGQRVLVHFPICVHLFPGQSLTASVSVSTSKHHSSLFVIL